MLHLGKSTQKYDNIHTGVFLLTKKKLYYLSKKKIIL